MNILFTALMLGFKPEWMCAYIYHFISPHRLTLAF
jgi:hypothetical protein